MNSLTLNEVPPQGIAVCTSIVKAEPLILSASIVSVLDPRDERAKLLATKYVTFVDELVPEIIEVRRDFMEKGSDETICGCKTFTDYCLNVLRTSTSHIRRLISGQNPAAKFSAKKPFKKSNRQLAEDGTERQHVIELRQARDLGFEEGRVAERTAQVILAGKAKPTLAKQKTVTQDVTGVNPETVSDMFYVIRNSDNLRFITDDHEQSAYVFSAAKYSSFEAAIAVLGTKPRLKDVAVVKVEATYQLMPVAGQKNGFE